MGNNKESEPTSGFVIPSEIAKNDGFTDFTNIPSRGVFQLTRAKRNGRWWMLKGLQEKADNRKPYPETAPAHRQHAFGNSHLCA